jgi:hypothetical protein
MSVCRHAAVNSERASVSPITRAGEQIRHFNVHAWVSENYHELVRLEIAAPATSITSQMAWPIDGPPWCDGDASR